MRKNCTQCSAEYEVTKGDLAFYESVSPIFAGKKELIPPPTRCPDCRFQRRLTSRNERFLYHRKSDLTGKQIVSIYAPEKPYIVYDQDEFQSDRWDDLEHGRDFDFNRTFAEQFRELGLKVPHKSLFTINSDNSYYTNHTLNLKNCYLLFGGGNSEDCMFGRFVITCKDTVDGLSLYSCQWCYEGTASQDCYQCMFFTNCRHCSDCVMVEDCQNCKNCCLCFGLNNGEYKFLNEQLTKEEYEAKIADLFPLTRTKIENMRTEFNTFKKDLPHPASHIFGSEDCTGDMIFNSRSCHHSFDVTDCEDSTYQCYTPKSIHSYDCTYTAPDGVQHSYEAGSTVGIYGGLFAFQCWYGDNAICSRECTSCSNIFGCISLRNRKYCVFNKQYTKEEYEKLVPRIIEHMRKTGEWGEYFDPSLSYMGYNETVAQELFPITRDEALAKDWNWFDAIEKKETYLGPKTEFPETIAEVTDAICDQILSCDVTDKPFKIIPQELKFYRTMGIPLPKKCPDQRHLERMVQRSPRKLWNRTCDKCSKPMETTYSPDRPETVYCEECYLASLY